MDDIIFHQPQQIAAAGQNFSVVPLLTEQANRMKSGLSAPANSNATNSKLESDKMTQDSQKRLDALKLHDDAVNGNKQTSVCKGSAIL